MGRDKGNERREEQFAKWVRAHSALPAWKALGFPAREAYNHLKVRCMAETAARNRKVENNNGSIFLSSRKLAEEMGCTPKTAMAAFADLQAKGWIVCTKPSQLGIEGRGTAAHYRLTMFDMGSGPTFMAATREPERWASDGDYPVLEFRACKPKPRGQRVQNISPHPIRSQACTPFGISKDLIEVSPAPHSVSVVDDFGPSPAPHSVSYLITMGKGKSREGKCTNAIKAGLGLCGKAIHSIEPRAHQLEESRSKAVA